MNQSVLAKKKKIFFESIRRMNVGPSSHHWLILYCSGERWHALRSGMIKTVNLSRYEFLIKWLDMVNTVESISYCRLFSLSFPLGWKVYWAIWIELTAIFLSMSKKMVCHFSQPWTYRHLCYNPGMTIKPTSICVTTRAWLMSCHQAQYAVGQAEITCLGPFDPVPINEHDFYGYNLFTIFCCWAPVWY